jgi:sigma-B regulation protein RsbU (phosphoserine phosphatase)
MAAGSVARKAAIHSSLRAGGLTMLARHKVLWAAIIACALLAIVGTILGERRLQRLERELDGVKTHAIASVWEAVTRNQTAELRHRGADAWDAVRRAQTPSQALLDELGVILKPTGVTLIALVAADGSVTLWPAGSVPFQTLVAPAVLAEALAADRTLSGILRVDERIFVASAFGVRIDAASPPVALLVARDGGALLREVQAETGVAIGIADVQGRFLIAPAGPAAWAAQTGAVPPSVGQARLLAVGDRVLSEVDLPLTDLSGHRIGYRRAVLDETDRQWVADTDWFASTLALLLVFLLVCLAQFLWSGRVFRRLEQAMAAMQALARGDTTVQIDRAEGNDETSAAASALLVFRRNQVAVQIGGRRTEQRRSRKLQFIENQLDSLSATLGHAERAAMQEEIRRNSVMPEGAEHGESDALDTLAVAFRVMVSRVSAQYQSLQALVAEKDRALSAQQRMQALEQEMSMVGAMQARLAPAALPTDAQVAVRSWLQQGDRVGGDFLDFFWLDAQGGPVRRLAVVLGHVDGEGLQAAFLAITARALVRALAGASASPGTCLGQVSDLLVGDNAAAMPVNILLAIIDVGANVLVAARAGMPLPLTALRAGACATVAIEGAPPLGLRHGLRVPDTTRDLPERALLVLYGHGLSEAEIDGRPLGAEGMCALLAEAPDLDVEPLVNWLAARVRGGDIIRHGDASLVALRLR